MAVPFSNTKLRVPKGFQNILEGLAREILRTQPANPFEFGAKYFDQLLKVRDETGHDPAVHGAKLEDRFYNNDSFKSPSVDPGSPQQQDAALKIQTNYRKHDAEQKVAAMKQEHAAETIQAGVRGHEEREKVKDMKAGKKEEEEVDIDLNDPAVEAAATKIQAGFKGFKARHEIKAKNSKVSMEKTNTEPDAKGQDEGQAEEVIQNSFPHRLSKHNVDEGGQDDDAPGTSGVQCQPTAGSSGVVEGQSEGQSSEEVKGATAKSAEEEEVDIDLNDPEVAVAAEKIQAGFKKHMMKKRK